MKLASAVQARLVNSVLLRPHDPSTNWALLCQLPARTDSRRFAAAVEDVLNNNDAFTEKFIVLDNGEVQVVSTEGKAHVEVTRYESEAAVQNAAAEYGDTVYPADSLPMYHAEVALVGNNKYFIFAGAHAISDGFGYFQLVQDFAERYENPSYRSPCTHSPSAIAEQFMSQEQEVREYYTQLFRDVQSLQIDQWVGRDSAGRILGSISRASVDGALYDQIGALARAMGVRRFSVLLSALAVAVYRLSSENKFAISVPMSNRRSGEQAATTRGARVNPLPVKFDFSESVTFDDLCKNTNSQIAMLINYEQYPFSNFARSILGSDAMDATTPSVSFTLYPEPLAAIVENERGQALSVSRRYLQHPLSLNIEVADSGVTLIIERADFLGDCDVAAIYTQILTEVVASEGMRVVDGITWFTPAMAAVVMPQKVAEQQTLVDLFANSVTRSPDAVAIRTESKTVTYAELESLSNGIAHWLISEVPHQHVGVCSESSIELVATILGVFKAGKVYVPIDYSIPPDRISLILNQCSDLFFVTLSGKQLPEEFPQRAMPEFFAVEQPVAESFLPVPLDPAYIIFTSGTTGQPKGVCVSHFSAARTFARTRESLSLSEGENWLLFHSLSFDISLAEIFGALSSAGTLSIPTAEVRRDSAQLGRFVDEYRIQVVSQTPSALAKNGRHILAAKSVHTVILCGERLNFFSMSEQIMQRPDVKFFNCYGITETTIYHTGYQIPSDSALFNENSIIGVPFLDMGMAVVDEENRLLPRGVIGQLTVSGAGLMMGYINRPELTAEKIISLNGVPNYLTGDRGYLASDGQFIVLGRDDDQVKIRGHRCELGEIDAALLKTGYVRASASIVVGEGLSSELVCFVVMKNNGSAEIIRGELTRYLPKYLEPDQIILVPEMPINTNGKTDKPALRAGYLAVAQQRAVSSGTLDERSAVHEVVEKIWSEVLGTNNFNGATRFFDAGGNSAMVLRIYDKLKNQLDVKDLDVVDLFEYCTVDSLVDFMTGRS